MNYNHDNSPWTPDISKHVLELAATGIKAAEIGLAVGMTRCQIIGWMNRHHRGCLLYPSPSTSLCKQYEGPTSMDRLQALHDKMDAVLLKGTTSDNSVARNQAL